MGDEPNALGLAEGLYEQLITEQLARRLDETRAAGRHVEQEPLDPSDAPNALGLHLGRVIAQATDQLPEEQRASRGAELARDVVAALAPHLQDPGVLDPIADDLAVLLSVADPHAWGNTPAPARPRVPLSDHDLLVMGRDEPGIGNEIQQELASADRVDLLCAFITWHGFRILAEPLAELVVRGGRLRIITTTYMGATERRALDELIRIGADVRVAYDTATTRLHAKAWLFHRDTGYSTAYVGSSNLSRAAMLDGLEWNVRLAAARSPELIGKFTATFDAYWESDQFEGYDPERDADRFDELRATARGERRLDLSGLELRPWPYQQEILEALETERERRHRTRNLVVAPTGTGKTVVAALDYARLRDQHDDDLSLLFVAHRHEILTQSRRTFAEALRDAAFGELLVGGEVPERGRHVFASIQSLHAGRLSQLDPEDFDVVIVDEFHHAEARTYRRLLEHVRPRYLLGLTATPERADGESVLHYFDGHVAFEQRLWDAIDQQLLCPFQYFGVADDVPLDQLAWKRGGYDLAELSELYTGNDARTAKVLEALGSIVTDVGEMRALGFCVSVAHAEYMARRFTEAGIPARAITGQTARPEREAAQIDLRDRVVNVLFTVDLFNEGIDLPEVDTILLLRPTESPTVFLQQLGRGLRQLPDKPVCTVLDFIGQQHRRFRFDLRYRALLGASRARVAEQVEEGFPFLPSGCHIELDRVASRIVLDNVRRALPSTAQALTSELRELANERGDVDLATFLDATGLEPHEPWKDSIGGWQALRRRVRLPAAEEGPEGDTLTRRISSLAHQDDPERLGLAPELTRPEGPSFEELDERQQRVAKMLIVGLRAQIGVESWDEALARIRRDAALRADLRELVPLLDERSAYLTHPSPLHSAIPLHEHASYGRDEILAAFDQVAVDKNPSLQAGVFYHRRTDTDVLLVTLRKSERHYSPTTLYNDYAISPDLFHWESQSTTTRRSETGQRYLATNERRGHVLLFVREERKLPGGLSAPYLFLGRCRLVEARGERPIAITWRLERPMPRTFFQRAKAAAS